MPPLRPAEKANPRSGNSAAFTLYVEGPRDRSILRAWAYRLMPIQARGLFRSSVILGGRQPDRAFDHFRERHADTPGASGLCVLDRDGGDEGAPDTEGYDLDFFTWRRRHIESYLLVPGAIRRALSLSERDHRVDRILEEYVPDSSATQWQRLDAKRLLGAKGPLARILGAPLPLAKIAQATREPELDPDVHDLFARLRQGLDPAVR